MIPFPHADKKTKFIKDGFQDIHGLPTQYHLHKIHAAKKDYSVFDGPIYLNLIVISISNTIYVLKTGEKFILRKKAS